MLREKTDPRILYSKSARSGKLHFATVPRSDVEEHSAQDVFLGLETDKLEPFLLRHYSLLGLQWGTDKPAVEMALTGAGHPSKLSPRNTTPAVILRLTKRLSKSHPSSQRKTTPCFEETEAGHINGSRQIKFFQGLR